MTTLRITDRTWLSSFEASLGGSIPTWFASFDSSQAHGDVGYQTQVSAVFSSNIEGNTIDLNTFMNLRLAKGKFRQQKEVLEIEELVAAYTFAQQTALDEASCLKAHRILSKSILTRTAQGKYRTDRTGVFSEQGLVYLAVEPEFVEREMKELFADIHVILSERLSVVESFYFSALLHLKFVHIHPFADGNGRMARLLEKWFLASSLGEECWKLPSEKYYREHQAEYYRNINLGVNYYELDYSRCLPFLQMLPHCLSTREL